MAENYTSSDVTTLTPMEHIRLRPGVYLGGDVRTTAAREPVDNALDEVARGFATEVWVTVHDDSSIEVVDNGRGLPVDFDAEAGINGIVKTLGTAMSGTNFEGDGTGAGTNGVGASATNAISTRFSVRVWRDGKMYSQDFREGVPGTFAGDAYDPAAAFTPKEGQRLRGVAAGKSAPASGTLVRFTFDPSIAPESVLDVDDLALRAKLSTILTPGATLHLSYPTAEGRVEDTVTYGGPAGALSLTGVAEPAMLTADGTFTVTRRSQDNRDLGESPVSFSVALAPSAEQHVIAAVNSVHTPDGGHHVNKALRAIGAGAAERRVRGLPLNPGEEYPGPDAFAATVSMALSVRTPAPRFVGQDKRALNDIALGNGIERELTRHVKQWAAIPANNDALTAWATRALEWARVQQRLDATRAAAAAKKARAGAGTNLNLPDKFLPSILTGRGKGSELHLCEGDSALATLKAARYAQFQAGFPLRGKPVKTWGVTAAAAMKNQEVRDIAAILGCGIGAACDPEACNFDRVIFTADADVDGYNIAASLMSMFISHFRPLVDAGMVFISTPPLFIVTARGGVREYCIDEHDRDETVAALRAEGATGIDIQRCKGLGEMDAKDFRATVMDPATRMLFHVQPPTESDMAELDVVFGGTAEGRREWMAHHSASGDIDAADVLH